MSYVKASVVSILYFDAVTGLTIGPLFFGQTFMGSLLGQIPFTIMHLAGAITFSAILSPIFEKWVMNNKYLELNLSVWKVFQRKFTIN
jgi:uncharacterized membrane protein YbaN (DUF454 family)